MGKLEYVIIMAYLWRRYQPKLQQNVINQHTSVARSNYDHARMHARTHACMQTYTSPAKVHMNTHVPCTRAYEHARLQPPNAR